MGGQTNQVSLATSIINNAQQTIDNYCSITCNDNFNNNTIFVYGGNSNININQSCSNIGSECTIKNLISSEIENMISNIIQQSQSNLGIFSLLGPSQSNDTNISNAIKNQISQLINNSCYQNDTNNINGNNFFYVDANAKLNISQTGSMDHATCAMDTVAKIVLNNSVANNVKQTQSSCGQILAILIVVAVIIGLILIFFILSKVLKGKGGAAGGKGKGGAAGEEIDINLGGAAAPVQSPAPAQSSSPSQAPSTPGFGKRLSNWTSNAYNSTKSGFSNAYNSTKNFFTRSPTKTLQSAGLNNIQVPTETVAETGPSYHNSSLTVGKMLYLKKDNPDFIDAASGIPQSTIACSDGGTNLKCPPNMPIDRALNRLYDNFYAKK